MQTGGRPPAAADPGNPCPATAPVKQFTVSAVDVSLSHGVKGPAGAFVTGTPASPITFKPDPLVLHVAAGDCVEVAFTNKRVVRSSFHVNMLLRSPDSSGVNAGFNSEQTVATGGSRTYRYYADGDRYETALISDFGAPTTVPDSNGDTIVDPGRDGMYGAIVVAPAGATFTDPQLGGARSIGTPVDVHIPGKAGYRDYTLMLGDEDEKIGQNEMPYPTDVHGPATINYDTAGPRIDGPSMFSSAANGGDPETPLIQAYPGDPIRVHAISAPATSSRIRSTSAVSTGRRIRGSRSRTPSRRSGSSRRAWSTRTSPPDRSATTSTATCAGRSRWPGCGACRGCSTRPAAR